MHSQVMLLRGRLVRVWPDGRARLLSGRLIRFDQMTVRPRLSVIWFLSRGEWPTLRVESTIPGSEDPKHLVQVAVPTAQLGVFTKGTGERT
jgi:hypothetical protein